MEIKNNKIVATPRSKYHKYLFGGSSGSSSGVSISIDTNNFVKKTGETSQTVEGDIIVNGNIISTGEISAYGAGTGSTGGGTSYNRLDNWVDYGVDKAGYVLSAYLGSDLNSRLIAVENNNTTTISFANITGKPTTLGGYGITDALLSSSYTAADVLSKIKTVDGSGSGLDADTVDGLHSSSFFKVVLNNPTSVNDYTFWENSAGKLYNTPDAPYNYYSFLSFGQGIYQTQFNGYNNSLKFRSGSESGLTNKSWRTVAFEDSNVASATKLATTRTIWGQSFNGEGNITGDLTLSGNLNFNTSANQINSTSAVELALNYAGGGARHTSIFNGQGGFIMRAHYNGNVGIGTSEPQYKLDVSGSFRVNHNYSTTFTGNDINFTRTDGSSYINAGQTLSLGAGGTSGVLNLTNANVATFKELLLADGARIYSAAGAGLGISLFNEPSFNPNYGLMFAQTVYKGKHGAVNGDWATYFTMSPDAGRGWIFTNSASSSNGNVASISNTGNLTCSGEVTAYSASDIRLKTNIKKIDSAIDVINKLNPVQYNWNSVAKELNPLKTDSTEYGLIAQELEEVLPELVHPIYDGEYKSIDYVKIVPLLIGAIKELQLEINELKNK